MSVKTDHHVRIFSYFMYVKTKLRLDISTLENFEWLIIIFMQFNLDSEALTFSVSQRSASGTASRIPSSPVR